MRRLLAFVLTLLLASPLFAQTGGSRVVGLGAGGGGATTDAGSSLPSCSANSILYTDAGKLLQCNPASVVNGSVSTAGRSILTIADTISGGSATSNFLNITGTFPATLSAETNAALISVTFDNDAQTQSALKVLGAGTADANAAVVRINNGASIARPLVVEDNGTAVLTIADGGTTTVTQPIIYASGSLTNASMAWTGSVNSGFYSAGSGSTISSLGGAAIWATAADAVGNAIRLTNTVAFGWSSGSTASVGLDTGLTRLAAGVIGAGAGATPNWIQNSAGEVALNADYTNATATFSSTALSVTVISGRTYNFSMNLTFADSTAADGAQFDFNGGSAAATNFRVHCMSTNAAGAILAQSNAASTALATANSVTLALTTQSNLVCNGTFVPSGNGTFIVRAAQAAHTAGTLTVHRGSWLSVKDARPL